MNNHPLWSIQTNVKRRIIHFDTNSFTQQAFLSEAIPLHWDPDHFCLPPPPTLDSASAWSWFAFKSIQRFQHLFPTVFFFQLGCSSRPTSRMGDHLDQRLWLGSSSSKCIRSSAKGRQNHKQQQDRAPGFRNPRKKLPPSDPLLPKPPPCPLTPRLSTCAATRQRRSRLILDLAISLWHRYPGLQLEGFSDPFPSSLQLGWLGRNGVSHR